MYLVYSGGGISGDLSWQHAFAKLCKYYKCIKSHTKITLVICRIRKIIKGKKKETQNSEINVWGKKAALF